MLLASGRCVFSFGVLLGACSSLGTHRGPAGHPRDDAREAATPGLAHGEGTIPDPLGGTAAAWTGGPIAGAAAGDPGPDVVAEGLRLAPLSLTQDAARPARGPEAGDPSWGERFQFDVFFIPALWIQADVDRDDRAFLLGEPELQPGPGLGVRAAVGSRDQSVGILYVGSAHDEENARGNVQAHSVYLDFDVRAPIADGPAGTAVVAGAGLGLAWVEYERAYDDTMGGAANLRLAIEFRPWKRFGLDFGLGGFVWGYPGETQAYGTFVIVGGKLDL